MQVRHLYLFIFESIGTSELILIGIVALMFLGPRKLPQIARTVGKTMADLRNTTNEFKATWQREVDFEEEAEALKTGELSETARPDTVPSIANAGESSAVAARPQVREMSREQFDAVAGGQPGTADAPDTDNPSDKRNWL